ncbi:hypothetical protein LEP1GSC060_3413 [Leptospira weilii serovar Ranarum str. ICFT]|uniref:Uncharacterized protein n=1 Tax=Leptospira weilii serovar Ranarum str. ICFT TaxID=1218598 RepID=N1WDH7_9LEPT|nr:hypothetical protein LEP1GSC060_3413 [Leptospira weilii serovar Ranarum str. ICFT]
MKKIEIPLDDLKRIFKFLENVHDWMHQPLYYRNIELVEKFVNENYEEVKELYYHVIWNRLPEGTRNEIEEN